ncbi:hypothetical protein CH339_15825 [Rhodobium orientis]|uniref:Response regulatory domain-containing protein n=1 Tax=Rhodobium orientis TaxID=34017 RepID=A0A327JJ43_9HYPH|nr:response regulator [Rhodobium orientis]MBK5949451.1 hypothetical protein [Rhodobium orientis]RAI26021.1 hypothetical protein CH339_15825 [Rhodobium orientis]
MTRVIPVSAFSTSSDFEALHVLVVDDNSFFRKLERSMLRQLGVDTVYEASDGLDALTRLDQRECDLVLLDWNMPSFPGADFLRLIRDKDDVYFRSIPVIVVTSFANQALVLKAVELGANGVVVKPFSIALLRDRILATGATCRAGQSLSGERHERLPAVAIDDPTAVFDIDGMM